MDSLVGLIHTNTLEEDSVSEVESDLESPSDGI